jgi:uncharacterized protein YndB with AHSA1/START domain
MTQKIKTMELTFTRNIPASPAEVFDAWLDPRIACNVWHDADTLVFDPKVDSLFYMKMVHTQDGKKEETPHFGRFTIVDRPNKIQHTWMSPYTRGLESVVTVTLQKKGTDTVFSLNHAGLPDDEFGKLHEQGWNSYVASIAKLFPQTAAKVAA